MFTMTRLKLILHFKKHTMKQILDFFLMLLMIGLLIFNAALFSVLRSPL
jgi:hypothetical protein